MARGAITIVRPANITAIAPADLVRLQSAPQPGRSYLHRKVALTEIAPKQEQRGQHRSIEANPVMDHISIVTMMVSVANLTVDDREAEGRSIRIEASIFAGLTSLVLMAKLLMWFRS